MDLTFLILECESKQELEQKIIAALDKRTPEQKLAERRFDETDLEWQIEETLNGR